MMVNINITIPETLHKDLKIAAAIEETTIKDLIITALEQEKKSHG